jgi:hypothetical protein
MSKFFGARSSPQLNITTTHIAVSNMNDDETFHTAMPHCLFRSTVRAIVGY